MPGRPARAVLQTLDGVDERALRQLVLPSGRTPMGLLSHLTLDVERFRLCVVAAGAEWAPPGTLDRTTRRQLGREPRVDG